MNGKKMKKKDKNTLLNQDTAVENYLDTLLQEATDNSTLSKPVKEKGSIALLPEINIDAAPNREKEKTPDDKPLETLSTTIEENHEAEEVQHSAAASSTDYDFPIQCLMFRVGDNKLCIPLIKMGSVLPWTENLTQLPYMPKWFMGLLKYRGKNVRVADTAKLLKIDDSPGNIEERRILVFGQESWAIVCDEIGEVVQLKHDDVQWSAHKNKGLSLGTVKQSLAILLDPIKLLKRLNNGETLA